MLTGGRKSEVERQCSLFEDEIDYLQAYHDILTEGLDVSLDFVSEMCEAFVMFDKVILDTSYSHGIACKNLVLFSLRIKMATFVHQNWVML